LNDKGEPIVPAAPKIHGDLRTDFKAEQIELARKGLWKVVNEDGGTGGKARLSGVQVAGKTGTAQAMTGGKKDTIAWFACFAPYNQPKYAIAVMVQGGEHGGSVAAPIATRILERTLAMDEGNFDAQVAWLAPAHKQNPFQMIPAVDFKDASPKLNGGDDEEKPDDSQGAANAQMADAGRDPDVEPEADARGQVGQPRVARALPVQAPQPPPRPRNFFERIFGAKRQQAQPQPAPKPTPARRPLGR
jgi:penicillin-binding protein 2